MAKIKIRLTIQEIVQDFETLVRYDERLGIYLDHRKVDNEMTDKFNGDMIAMVEKYIPNYLKMVPEEYFSEVSAFGKALMLYKMLYENFLEIFAKLV